MEQWHDFFVATAGASAALAGLVFVGVSISLGKVLDNATLPPRALIALILFFSILLISIIMLVPDISLPVRGIIVLPLSLTAWIRVLVADLFIYRKRSALFRRLYLANLLLDQLALFPNLIGSSWLLLNKETAPFWFLLAILFSLIKVGADAWVLLIEINR